jgi:Zn-dependent protease with chaperone function
VLGGVCCCGGAGGSVGAVSAVGYIAGCFVLLLSVQRVADLEGSKADLEHQLAGMAGLIASSEARQRELSADRAAALAAAEVAAAAAAKAQSSVGEQVRVCVGGGVP